MFGTFRRKVAIGAAAVAAVAAGGGAYAATQSGTDARQAFLNDVAKRLNVSPKQLSSAISGAARDQLNAAVKAGKLTQAQADAINRRIAQDGGLPPLAPLIGPGRFGPGGFEHPFFHGPDGHGPDGAGPEGPGGLGGPLAGAAGYLGLTDAQLLHQLSSGKSLAQIAKARGKSMSGLKQAMTAAAKARLDKAVAAKMLSSAQEQQILSEISARISGKIARSGYGPRFRFSRGGPPPGAPSAGGIAGPPAGLVPGPAPGVAY